MGIGGIYKGYTQGYKGNHYSQKGGYRNNDQSQPSGDVGVEGGNGNGWRPSRNTYGIGARIGIKEISIQIGLRKTTVAIRWAKRTQDGTQTI